MSTNYYLEDKCTHCGRSDQIHLGKSSAGWTFTFRGDKENGIVDFASWLKRIDDCLENQSHIIVNEYGDPVIRYELLELIDSKKNEKNNHALYVEKEYSESFSPFKDWTDSGGNSFTDCEFS
jgi:hypothetical protein